MSDKQKTAVQWYFDEIEKLNDKLLTNQLSRNEYSELRAKIIATLRAMEREQIIKAHADAGYLQSSSLTMNMCVDNAEQYYTETYGE